MSTAAVTPRPLRILLADDHPAFLAGLETVLRTIPGAEVVAEVTDGASAIDAVAQVRPDIVLMDVGMPEVDGIEATRVITRSDPHPAVLILTALYDDQGVLAAMRAGAAGYILKGAGRDDIRRAIDAVSHGDMIFDAQAAQQVYQHLARPQDDQAAFPDLTERELAVLELVANGVGNAQIARELGLSVKTVRNYLSRIFAKLQVSDRTEAAIRARRAGLGS